ncbi:hypothetical protein [Vibrio phage RYC]|nr:hypothetical protein [Vibrio phage RYC]
MDWRYTYLEPTDRYEVEKYVRILNKEIGVDSELQELREGFKSNSRALEVFVNTLLEWEILSPEGNNDYINGANNHSDLNTYACVPVTSKMLEEYEL